jgi:cytochrome P450
MIFNNLKLMVYGNAARKIPGLTNLLMAITPKKILEEGKAHMDLAVAQANKRLAMKTDRNDIMSYILRHNGEETGMSVEEIQAQSYVIIIGGSETTATLLSGAVYYLCTNPKTLEKLTEEIRSSFTSESEISFNNVSSLKYLLAVLNEALRVYPPIPGSLPREVPGKGARINGEWVPSGTAVAVCQWAACRSKDNFRDPNAFIPERWLGDEKYADDVRDACQPFSYGPRNCVGRNLAYMEMRIILARLIWNFDLELSEESENWANQKVFLLYEKPPLIVKLTKLAEDTT